MYADFDNGGGTDWAQKTVPEMWSMLAAHDGTAHKNLLLTWLQSAELLIDHLSRVKRYRDNLAEAWPPDKSRAAEKYLDRLDDLITHLSNTYQATVENHRALGAATSALVGARVKLESIYRAHLANQQDLEAYARKLQANKQVVGKYRLIAPNPPTAAEVRQFELQVQAQGVMSALSTDLAQAQLNITTPPRYILADNSEIGTPFEFNSPSGPATHQSKNTVIGQPSVDGSSTKAEAITSSPNTSTTPTPNSPTHEPIASTPPPGLSTSPTPGPILSEITAPAPPINPSTPPGNTGGYPASGTSSLPITPVAPIPSIPGTSKITLGATTPLESPLAKTQGSFPGGVIGNPTGTRSAQPGASASNPQRINPAGGVIGQPGTLGGPIRSGRTSKSSEGKGNRNRWDPDYPWETEEGVAPVLLPPEKRDIDPGPAIGLP
ncbi:hypothetical protein [Actinoplanes sp. HUAS TT8]|uniref:hypothetical protein n=1 Tax=Actinoplanes sp. HUAS TT8 TaxID=3447453 RepID=UPI003F51CF5A